MNVVKILAPAKINLHLQITSGRNDGYHNLISLFQMVSLYDEIHIEPLEEDVIVLSGVFNCHKEENLIYKAAAWIKKNYSISTGFSITCEKHIPMGAGLGGGSSDAAATLMGIQSLLGLDISHKRLKEGALELGSDVPFFLGSATAIAKGRGEDLLPLRTRNDLALLITDTGINSNTKEAFTMFDKTNKGPVSPMTSNDIADMYLKLHPSSWEFHNSFNTYLCSTSPVFERILSILEVNGSDYSSITGTGSSVFGVFSDIKKIDDAQKALKRANIRVYSVKMLANRPKPVYN